jgi:Lhr-like helicase
VRYKSHEGLPEDKRKVMVERYISQLPTIKSWLGDQHPKSVDEYLVDMSRRKQELNRQFLDALIEASKLKAKPNQDRA